ncbi:MAG TPA: tetratricopeptide repeat protein [Thermoanaerobaculia bacterium]|nr:tetratricopeptide repeat protein [Thermoanaerobaculia bacterium]
MAHVTDEEIAKLLTGGLEAAEHQRVFRHLVGPCLACRARLGLYAPALYEMAEVAIPTVVPTPQEEAAYDGVIDRVFARISKAAPRVQEERRQLEETAETARREGMGAIEKLPGKLPDWAVVEVLLRMSHEARFRDRREMQELALFALAAANNLDPERNSPGLVADLRMRAWAELGNAYRVNDDFAAAESAFAQATALYGQRSGDPLAVARVLDLLASLRRNQRRLPEAIDLLDTVHGLYEESGEHHLAGRALISKGICTYYDGRPQEAAKLLREGLTMLSSERDAELVTSSQQNLLLYLVDSGEARAARRLLLESGLRQKLAGQPVNLLKLRWVEGKIYAGLGQLDQAVATFEEVRDGFLRHGLEYDAALLGLDLAEVWLRQGRNAEVAEIAQEVRETFEDLKVQREALRAMRFLESACRQELATPVLVQQVVSFLKRIEWAPGLQFAP